MSTQRYSPEFKEEAVRQIVDRGYSVTEVSQRLGGDEVLAMAILDRLLRQTHVLNIK